MSTTNATRCPVCGGPLHHTFIVDAVPDGGGGDIPIEEHVHVCLTDRLVWYAAWDDPTAPDLNHPMDYQEYRDIALGLAEEETRGDSGPVMLE